MGQLWPSGKLFPIGFTRGGSFFYGVFGNMNDVYVAGLGPGGAAATPAKVTQRFEGSNTAPEWSWDGKRLAWLSQREGTFTVVIRDLESGEEREVGVSTRMTRIMGGIRWSPDGASFLVPGMAKPQKSWQGIFSIDAETGEVTQIAQADPNGPLRSPVWSPDGKTVYFERRLATGGGAAVALDLLSGEERVVQPGNVGNMALSPDGTQLAFTSDSYSGDQTHVLRVVPTAGGEVREIFRSKESEPFHLQTPLAWTPDGRHLLVGTGSLPDARGDAKLQLWRISVEGGTPENLGLEMPHLAHLRVHPDGKRIAFEAGVRKPEIWLIENFLPKLKASR